MLIKIKKGLDIPITGAVKEWPIQNGPKISTVGINGPDYIGMKPSMLVNVGDQVALGQPLFLDKKNLRIKFTAPAAGQVKKINRGKKRAFFSIELAISGDQKAHSFTNYIQQAAVQYTKEQMTELLLESGLWPTLRTRPFSKIPDPDSTAHALFITATDTNPLAADPTLIIKDQSDYFHTGLEALLKLGASKTYLCKQTNETLPGEQLNGIITHQFTGVHPAGNVGTHIHYLDPVSNKITNWHINYQDVIAIGYLMKTGKLYTDRFITLAGPGVKHPQLIKTRIGACLKDLTANALMAGELRVISGSVLNGRKLTEMNCCLGRFHHQVTVLQEDHQRTFLGWLTLGANVFSVKKNFLSSWLPSKKYAMTTTTHGSLRAIVPVGSFEKVMPLDILITYLLRSLLSNDTDRGQELGVLELDEEDLGLCTFVCPGKNEYGPVLRANLNQIEKDG